MRKSSARRRFRGCGLGIMYLSVEGGPDGLDVGYVGGFDDGLEFVGLVSMSCSSPYKELKVIESLGLDERTVISRSSSARIRAA